jgi:hypothetical protein
VVAVILVLVAVLAEVVAVLVAAPLTRVREADLPVPAARLRD